MKKYLFGWQVWVIATAAFLAIGWVLFVPGEPHGRFADPNIGCIGMACYEFKDGTVWLVVPEVSPRSIGTYSKIGGHWEWQTPDGATILHASFLAMKMDAAPGHIYWRYFWFSDFLDALTDKVKGVFRS